MSPALQPAESFPTPATSAGDIVLRVLTAPDSLDGLLPGQGLGAYSRYRAGETLAILRRVLKAPEGRLVAALAGGTLVGYLALYQPSPEERWGQRPIPGLLELGALEVDRAWRRRGLARALLQATFAGGELDTAILIAPLYACDWDLETSGLQWREYRHLIHRLFRRHGFADFVTDDPLVTADPRNCLLVRVGEAAAPGLYQAFRALLSEVSPRVSAAEADRHQQYLGPGFTAIRQINQLPPEEQEAIYRRLIPRRVVELLTLDPATGRDPRGDRLVTYVCPPDQGFVRIEVRQHPPDQDCVFLLKLTQPAEELVEIAFIIAHPQSRRGAQGHAGGSGARAGAPGPATLPAGPAAGRGLRRRIGQGADLRGGALLPPRLPVRAPRLRVSHRAGSPGRGPPGLPARRPAAGPPGRLHPVPDA
ncbi:MAG: GNAT family N-acetyltransferase [candidate division NC10 bacterium]|nr:GNAT family N-acetyltransferase [candidate division NC10 bacterium]